MEYIPIVVLVLLGLVAFIAHLRSHLRKKRVLEKAADIAAAIDSYSPGILRGRFSYYDSETDTQRCYVYTGTEGCTPVDCNSDRYIHFCSDYPADNWPDTPGEQVQ